MAPSAERGRSSARGRCFGLLPRHALVVALLLLAPCSVAPTAAAASGAAVPSATQAYFNHLDSNRDGQLQPEELASHITQTLGEPLRAAAPAQHAGAAAPPAAPHGAEGGSGTPMQSSGGGGSPMQGYGGASDDDDDDDDGSADPNAAAAAGGGYYATRAEVLQAVQQAVSNVDGSDAGTTISVAELERHLAGVVLQGVRVSDWISHGLSLPQYQMAFKLQGVTPLDFPMLVEGGGRLLEAELGVASPLHQQRILRAMQRKMLGLGREPSAPAAVACHTSAPDGGGSSSSSRAAGGGGSGGSGDQAIPSPGSALKPGQVMVSWSNPEDVGQPHYHKLTLERLPVAAPGAGWQAVAEVDSEAHPGLVDQVGWGPSRLLLGGVSVLCWGLW